MASACPASRIKVTLMLLLQEQQNLLPQDLFSTPLLTSPVAEGLERFPNVAALFPHQTGGFHLLLFFSPFRSQLHPSQGLRWSQYHSSPLRREEHKRPPQWCLEEQEAAAAALCSAVKPGKVAGSRDVNQPSSKLLSQENRGTGLISKEQSASTCAPRSPSPTGSITAVTHSPGVPKLWHPSHGSLTPPFLTAWVHSISHSQEASAWICIDLLQVLGFYLHLSGLQVLLIPSQALPKVMR